MKDKEGYYLGSDGERVHAPSGMTGKDASNYVKEKTHFKNSDG